MTINTIKFSEMTAGGDLPNDSSTPGLLSGANVLFNNPWTFLAPGSTADRPTPSPAINYRLRFNTDDQLYEYYDAISGLWTQLQETTFTTGPYVTYTASLSLPDAFNLGTLASGILKQTSSLGIATPAIAINGTDYYGPGFTGYFQSPAGVKDINSNIVMGWSTAGASSVNYLNITNSISGSSPIIAAAGLNTNINMQLIGKGLGGVVIVGSSGGTNPFTITNGTGYQHQTAFLFSDTAATRNVTFPDASGTVAFVASSAQNFAGDTGTATPSSGTINFTGGSTGLTFAASGSTLTLGGALVLTNGGTNASLNASNGGIVYSTASAMAILSGTATAQQLLMSASSTTPQWSTTTYPLTNAINTIMYASSANVLGVITPVNSAVLISSAGGVPSMSTTLPSGLTIPGYAKSGANSDITSLTGLTGVIQAPTSISDSLGNENLSFLYQVNAVNWITSVNSATGQPLGFQASGSDTDITFRINSKGNAPFVVITAATNNAFQIYNGTANQHLSTFSFSNTAASQVYTFPDATGTIALTSGASGIVSSGLINQLAYYAASGTTISGLATANSSVLVTSAGGVPSLSTTLPSGIAATNMNLTTPTLGVASATSINFGGSALSNYNNIASWTPVVTFVTPGDLSVAYSIQQGSYTRIGNLIFVNLLLIFTPTFTTSSGILTITGLPFTSNSTYYFFGTAGTSNIAFPTLTTSPYSSIFPNTNYILVGTSGSSAATSSLTSTQFTSGVAVQINCSLVYSV